VGLGVGLGAGGLAIAGIICPPTRSKPKPNGSTRRINCQRSRINCRFIDVHQGKEPMWVLSIVFRTPIVLFRIAQLFS
jgi:hypothetical protein